MLCVSNSEERNGLDTSAEWIYQEQNVNLRRKNIWQSTNREPKERCIGAMTRDARKLLGTAR